MCGIAGIISSERPIQTILDNMMESLEHRGPDNQSSYIEGNLGLAHTRLSIIDLSEEANQPIVDSTGRYVIIFNGEIYNYQELREDLRKQDFSFTTNSDTEVLLNGYIAFKEKIFTMVRGFYAVCIYDKLESSIFLTRDFFGKKPLYFYNGNNEFLFASEIKAITRNLEHTPSINYESLSHYLWRGYYANGDSAYEGIRSLKPGQSLKISLDLKEISKSGDQSLNKILVGKNYPKRNLDKVKNLLKEAISLRLVSDVPISFLLSGGIDSSLISSIAADQIEGPIDTHYLGYGEKRDEFKELSDFVSKKINSSHYSHILDEPEFDLALNQTVEVFDEPFADYSSIPSLEIYRLISQRTKVAISGDGADEIFGGYQDSKLFLLRSYLPQASLKSYRLLNLVYKLLNSSLRIIRYCAYFIAMILLEESMFSLITYRMGWNNQARKEFMTERGYNLTGGNRVELKEAESFFNSGRNILERYLNYDLNRLAYDFLVKVDRTSMANSLEVRCPFLDRTMVEKINPANSSDLLSLTETKKELKKLVNMRGLGSLIKSKKKGFTPPLDDWILSKKSITLLNQMISDEGSIIFELFDCKKLSKIIGTKKQIYLHRIRLWYLLVLYTWHNKNYR
jgi:asparagine synthase (glutamine-hydrolysing)